MSKKRAILIAGPTASGKSEVAVKVAKALDGVIINADSMQVYSKLDIITARPGPAELNQAPHVLYAIQDPAKAFSAADWLELAVKEAKTAWDRGKTPVFTGGTGLYFKALLEGLADIPDIPKTIQDEVRSQLKTKGVETLYMELQTKDPVLAKRLKARDQQRIVRALEVFRATGRPLSYWQEQDHKAPFPDAAFTKVCLLVDRETLEQRIRARFETMVKEGALGEAADFAGLGLDKSLPATKALGLRPLIRHLDGEISVQEAIDLAVIESRQYAKRQRTWFRNQFKDWTFVEASPKAADEIVSLAKNQFQD